MYGKEVNKELRRPAASVGVGVVVGGVAFFIIRAFHSAQRSINTVYLTGRHPVSLGRNDRSITESDSFERGVTTTVSIFIIQKCTNVYCIDVIAEYVGTCRSRPSRFF